MAKMVRLMVQCAAERVAEALEALADFDDVTIQRRAAVEQTDTDDTDDDTDTEVPAQRKRDVRRVATVPTARPVQTRTRMAGKVIYTPVGTAKQIQKSLDALRGVTTMRAMVLRDLAKHPGSSNKEVRTRIEPAARKAGLSVESVDNVIWQMVNKGQISKAAE